MLLKSGLLAFLLMALALGPVLGDTLPGVILDSPGFPPESEPVDCDRLASAYAAPPGSYLYFDVSSPLSIQDPVLACFELVEREQIDPSTERQTFNARIEAFGRDSYVSGSLTLSGTMVTLTSAAATEGDSNLEIEALDMSTTFNGRLIRLRESPTLLSSGSFSTIDLGSGRYAVSSGFELNIELGPEPWRAEETPVHMDLIVVGTPTPLASGRTWSQIKSVYR